MKPNKFNVRTSILIITHMESLVTATCTSLLLIMPFLIELLLLAVASPFISSAFLLAKGTTEGDGHEYTIDEYFERKEKTLKGKKTLLKAHIDRLDEYAVLVRPDLLVDDAAGKEIERRIQSRMRPIERRRTM